MSLKLLFIQLNEINFDLVDKYLSTSKKINLLILESLKILINLLILMLRINMKI